VIHDFEVKAGVLHALVAAGAEVTLVDNDIDTVNGRRPHWEIRCEYRLSRRYVMHVNVGRGSIGRGLRIIRPRGDVFDYPAIAAALIEDVVRQNRREAENQENRCHEMALRAKEEANADVVTSIVTPYGEQLASADRTTHCKLRARSGGIEIETVVTTEPEARAVVAAIERTLNELRSAKVSP